MKCTSGKAPARTIAIDQIIPIPSSIGAIPGITTIPVKFSMIAAASPIVITTTTPVPKYVNPVVIFSGINHNPIIIKTANMIIGTKFFKTVTSGKPATNPPTRQPKGIATIPARTPFAKYGLSSFSIIPKATGIVKTTVAPIIEPNINPANFPTIGSCARLIARGYPPMSFANNVVANIAGSAPSAEYTGPTIGFKIFARTGARETIPTIDRAKAPIAIIPSSNFSP